MPVTIDKSLQIPVYSPVCSYCKHLRVRVKEGRTCDAFEDGIPMSIWLGENDHADPFPGDNDIQFEPAGVNPT